MERFCHSLLLLSRIYFSKVLEGLRHRDFPVEINASIMFQAVAQVLRGRQTRLFFTNLKPENLATKSIKMAQLSLGYSSKRNSSFDPDCFFLRSLEVRNEIVEAFACKIECRILPLHV